MIRSMWKQNHTTVSWNVACRRRTSWKIKILLDNMDKIHTTEMGIDRIKKNLKIDTKSNEVPFTAEKPNLECKYGYFKT